jgi:hypothetical protein
VTDRSNRQELAGAFLVLCVLSLASPASAQVAQMTLVNDGTEDMFVTVTDNLAPTPTAGPPLRLNEKQSTTVSVNLDGNGDYNVTWVATDTAQPPAKTASESCTGVPSNPCNVDLFAASPTSP